ncbi:hypothetical protein JCM4814A_02430 [Streptomyces phaeofaciens JCM 4814]
MEREASVQPGVMRPHSRWARTVPPTRHGCSQALSDLNTHPGPTGHRPAAVAVTARDASPAGCVWDADAVR